MSKLDLVNTEYGFKFNKERDDLRSVKSGEFEVGFTHDTWVLT